MIYIVQKNLHAEASKRAMVKWGRWLVQHKFRENLFETTVLNTQAEKYNTLQLVTCNIVTSNKYRYLLYNRNIPKMLRHLSALFSQLFLHQILFHIFIYKTVLLVATD